MMDKERRDYLSYRINKAKETAEEIETLMRHGFFATALNRMYYACFYAASAALYRIGLSSKTHSGTRHLFGEKFVKTGKFSIDLARHYSDLFSKRQISDYVDFGDFDEQTVRALFPPTKEFVLEIKKLLEKLDDAEK